MTRTQVERIKELSQIKHDKVVFHDKLGMTGGFLDLAYGIHRILKKVFSGRLNQNDGDLT